MQSDLTLPSSGQLSLLSQLLLLINTMTNDN